MLKIVMTWREGELKDDLLIFTQQHFSREENLLEKCGHNDIKQYKSTHDFLLQALRKSYIQYKQNTINASELKKFLNEGYRAICQVWMQIC